MLKERTDPLGRTKPIHRCVDYPGTPQPEFKTFAEWEAGAECTADYMYGSGGNQADRTIYKMLGYTVFQETYTPWNIFKDPSVSMLVSDFNVTRNSRESELAATFGGVWEEGYYAEPGHGWPRFWGEDCTEKCWNFLTAWLEQRKVHDGRLVEQHA